MNKCWSRAADRISALPVRLSLRLGRWLMQFRAVVIAFLVSRVLSRLSAQPRALSVQSIFLHH